MNKQDYEKYYQKGGSYIIPVEIFNELLDDYECFKNDCKKYKDNWNKLKEIAKNQSDFKLKIRNKELWFEVDELLSKMQELEKGDSNE